MTRTKYVFLLKIIIMDSVVTSGNSKSRYCASHIFLWSLYFLCALNRWILFFCSYHMHCSVLWMCPIKRIYILCMCLSEDIVCGFVQHSGFLHVALGCWVLLTFGPQVCRGYGPFTFFLIYILGGIAGNLSSFLHTPEATVGGTVS